MSKTPWKLNVFRDMREKSVSTSNGLEGYQSRLSSLCITYGTVSTIP